MAVLVKERRGWLCWSCDRVVMLLAAGMIATLLLMTPPEQWFPLPAASILLFTMVTELLPVPLLRGGVQLTLGFPVVCTVIALHGTLPAVIIDGLPTLVAGLALNRTHPFSHRLHWSLFNTSQSAISAGIAGTVFHLIHEAGRRDTLAWTAVCITVSAVVYLIVNALLVSRIESTYQGEPFRRVFRYNLHLVLPTYVMAMPIVLILILLIRSYGILGFVAVAVPFLAARESFRQRIQQLRNYRETLRMIGVLVQRADPYTSGHMQRAARLVEQVATRLGIPTQRVELLLDAAALHDLGKVAIDEAVLNKIAPLTEEEWMMIRRHPVYGSEVMSFIRHFAPVGLWIMLHHERPDGKGYPFGLKMGEIPIEAHIVAVLDAFDAMVGDPRTGEYRPYRKPKTPEEAIMELRRCSGTQFHPAVVEAFIEAYLSQEQCADQIEPSAAVRKRAVA